MPLASPIGSGRGLKLRHAIEIMIEQAEVPVDRRRRARRAVAGRRGDGAGRRRRARQHRDRARRRSRRDGARLPPRRSRPAAPARLAGLIEELEIAEAVEPDRRPPRHDGHGQRPTAGDRARGRRSSRCSSGSASPRAYALVERNGEPVERDALRRHCASRTGTRSSSPGPSRVASGRQALPDHAAIVPISTSSSRRRSAAASTSSRSASGRSRTARCCTCSRACAS